MNEIVIISYIISQGVDSFDYVIKTLIVLYKVSKEL